MAHYPTMDEARAAGLFHCNCRHSVVAYLPGITRPMKDVADPQGYEDAKKLRYYERKVREKKRLQAVAITPEAKAKYNMQLEAYRAKIRDHVKATGIRRKRWRESFGVRAADLSAQGPQGAPTTQLSSALASWHSTTKLPQVKSASNEIFAGRMPPDTPEGRLAQDIVDGIQRSPRYTGTCVRGLSGLSDEDWKLLTTQGSVHDIPLSSFTNDLKQSKADMVLGSAGPGHRSLEINLETDKGGIKALDTLTDGEIISGGRFEVVGTRKLNYDGKYYTQVTMRQLPTQLPKVMEPATFTDLLSEDKVMAFKATLQGMTPGQAEKAVMKYMEDVVRETGGAQYAVGQVTKSMAELPNSRVGTRMFEHESTYGGVSSPAFREAMDWVDTRIYPGAVEAASYEWLAPGKRSRADVWRHVLCMAEDSRTGQYLHELAHMTFSHDDSAQRIIHAHFLRRTRGERLVQIPGAPHGELAKIDKFLSPYAGRVYDASVTDDPTGAEVLSMGIEAMQYNPERLLNMDPELFYLTLAWMRGIL